MPEGLDAPGRSAYFCDMTRFLIPVFALAVSPLQAGIEVEKDGNNLKVLVDGKLFTEFRSDASSPCLYPLMSPSGTHLTRQFPFVKGVEGEQTDHIHHVGFWLTHGAINGKDFWHSKKGEKIVCKGFVGEPEASGDSAKFTVDVAWEVDGKAVMTEQRSYEIAASGKTRTIDVTSTFKPADGDVTFGDTKEGFFAIRVAPTLRLKGAVAKGSITTSAGNNDSAAWGKRAKWVAYHGPDSAGTETVVAILDHKDNLRHPTGWHARDYGLLTANPFAVRSFRMKGDGAHTIKAGESLTQRYQLVLHQGDFESAKIEERWGDFTK